MGYFTETMIDNHLSKPARIIRNEGIRSFGNRLYSFSLKKTYPSIEKGCVKLNDTLTDPYLGKSASGILMYHGIGQDAPDFYGNISPNKLKCDLYNLSKDFNFVRLSQIAKFKEQMQLAVTFDDGLTSFYNNALPILREMEIPATVFVNPGFIGDSNKAKVESAHGIQVDSRITMNQNELMELVDDDLVTIGNHGMLHRNLGNISDKCILHEEIVESKSFLGNQIGKQPRIFCYPYGSYTSSAVELVKDEYEFAVSSDMYTVTTQSDPYLLPRIAAHENIEDIRWQLNPARDKLKRILRVPENAQELGW